MNDTRPYPWEASYPPGVVWDAPIRRMTLTALLDESVAKFGPRPFLEFRDRQMTYDELGRHVAEAAAGFRRLGIAAGDTVALYLPNTPYHPIGLFGALRAGARVVLLSPLDAPRVLAHKLADCGAKLLLSIDLPSMLPMALRLLAEGHVPLLVVGEDAVWGAPTTGIGVPAQPGVVAFADFTGGPGVPAPHTDPDDVALLQYTGGTTGLPRAAMLSHANLTAAISMLDAWNLGMDPPFGPTDRVVGVLPLFHIFALTGVLLRAISVGAEILLRPRFDAQSVLEDIEVKRATFFPGVPTMWIALANLPGLETHDLSSLRLTASGGAPLPAEIAAKIEQLTGQILGGGWGMTETSPIGSLIPQGMPFRPGMIGLPVPGVVMQVRALDDPRRVLGPNEVGELCIKGPNVTRGYYNRPEENARAFVDGFFLTGDVGSIDGNGMVFLVDRKKDMIISGGFNVYPRMIEDAIYEHPDVAECAVIGIPDPYRGQAAKAFVTLRPGAALLNLEALRIFLAERVGRHEMPAALEIRESLPKTPVGKLSRKDLADEEAARAGHSPTSSG